MDATFKSTLLKFLPSDLVECLNFAGIINPPTFHALALTEEEVNSEKISILDVEAYIRRYVRLFCPRCKYHEFIPRHLVTLVENNGADVESLIETWSLSPGYIYLLRIAQKYFRSQRQITQDKSTPIGNTSLNSSDLSENELAYFFDTRTSVDVIKSKSCETIDNNSEDHHLSVDATLYENANGAQDICEKRDCYIPKLSPSESISKDLRNGEQSGQSVISQAVNRALTTNHQNEPLMNELNIPRDYCKLSSCKDDNDKRIKDVEQSTTTRKRRRRNRRRSRAKLMKNNPLDESNVSMGNNVSKLSTEYMDDISNVPRNPPPNHILTDDSPYEMTKTNDTSSHHARGLPKIGHMIFDSDGEVVEERFLEAHPKVEEVAKNRRQCKQKANFSITNDTLQEPKAFTEVSKKVQLKSRQSNQSFIFKNDPNATISSIPAQKLQKSKRRKPTVKVDIDSTSTESTSNSSSSSSECDFVVTPATEKIEQTKFIDYYNYQKIHQPPAPGSRICFKVLELDPTTFTPEISIYKEGILISYEPQKDRCRIEVISNQRKCDGSGKFDVCIESGGDILTNYEEEEKYVITNWTALKDVRIMESATS